MNKRREHEEIRGDQGSDFTTKILGGEWTRTHKKKAFDAAIGIAVGGAPRAWCRKYGLNIEASFAFKKYGNDAATAMALEWCRRMQHFYDIYVLHGQDDHIYSGKELQSYEEALDWVNFLCASDVEAALWDRAESIRQLRPAPRPLMCVESKASSSSKSV